jgi:eukaryotic-like serine/threonine-protein kinase
MSDSLLVGWRKQAITLATRSKDRTEARNEVLADFDNKTGDTVFDDALKQALAVQLGQSPFLNILSDRKVEESCT